MKMELLEEVWTMDEHKEVEKDGTLESWETWTMDWKLEIWEKIKSGTRMNLKKMGIRM